MNILQRFQRKAAYHRERAALLDAVVTAIEEELHADKKQRRKVNGALQHFLDEPVSSNGHAPALTRKKKKRGPHAKTPQKGTITLEAAILKALAKGPRSVNDMLDDVGKFREAPTTKYAVAQILYTMRNQGKVRQGKGRKGVFGLINHSASEVRDVEKQIPWPNTRG